MKDKMAFVILHALDGTPIAINTESIECIAVDNTNTVLLPLGRSEEESYRVLEDFEQVVGLMGMAQFADFVAVQEEEEV